MIYRFCRGWGGIFKDINDYISFIITQNESKIIYHIKDKLGLGNITFDLKANTYRYKLLDRYSIYKFTPFFLYFLSHRFNQLQEWI